MRQKLCTFVCPALIAFPTVINRYSHTYCFLQSSRNTFWLFAYIFTYPQTYILGSLHNKWQQQFVEIIGPQTCPLNTSCLNNWKCNWAATRLDWRSDRQINLEPENAFEKCSPKIQSSPNITCQTQQNRTNSLSRNYDVCVQSPNVVQSP